MAIRRFRGAARIGLAGAVLVTVVLVHAGLDLWMIEHYLRA
jgi:hypothetical protein